MTDATGQNAGAGSLPPLIAAMTRPDFYPERPAAVELRQTHISYVLLAGEFVYKVKKPVRFPFLDASTLARRHDLCREEVRLNRRLAPSVYLEVTPLVRSGPGYALGRPGAAAQAGEFAVKMRRLDERRMLDRLIREGTADAGTLRAVAARVAAFHGAASRAHAWRYGSAAAVWRRVMGDLADYENFIGYTVSEAGLSRIENYCRAFVASHWEAINQRAHTGRVRECHGDLRAEQVCMDEQLNIFDCVEFSERLRYCDVASEAAFLAMDLDRLGAPRLAQEFISSYAELAGDEGLAPMLPFYKCYRASIRGMVETRRSLEPEVAAGERDTARALARAYFALARRYATLGAAAIVAVCGLSGAGKSTLARALHRRIGFEVLNSDAVRKRLAGVTGAGPAKEGYAEGIYSAGFTARTYDTMAGEAGSAVAAGKGVILDATFRNPANRRPVIEAAARAQVPLLFVECRCDEGEALRRLRERAGRPGEISDATEEVYLRQRSEFVAPAEVPAENHLVADTCRADPIGNALLVEERLAALHGLGNPAGLRAA